jgi:hypothetical protein
MLAKHPEYTNNQQVCAEYAARYKKACQVSQERVRQKEAFNVFAKDNPTFVGLSEGAIRPLINEQDPDIKEEAKQKIRSGVTKGQPMGAENVKRIIEDCKEHKVKSGRPIKNSNETIIAQVEGEDIEGDEMDLPCATCTHVCIPANKELEYESVEQKLTLFVEYLLSLGIKTGEIKAKFLKVLDTF